MQVIEVENAAFLPAGKCSSSGKPNDGSNGRTSFAEALLLLLLCVAAVMALASLQVSENDHPPSSDDGSLPVTASGPMIANLTLSKLEYGVYVRP